MASEQPDDRRASGLARYREVYGEDAVTFPEGEAAFFDLMMEHLFDGVWRREGLSVRERRLITMGVLAAQRNVRDSAAVVGMCADT